MRSHIARLLLAWLLPVLAFPTARAEEVIAFFGTEMSSGSSVLAVTPLPSSAFKEEGGPEPLKYTVVARGVHSPTQGENGSVLYWKGNRLWRYGQGKQNLLLEMPPYLGLGEAVETPAAAAGKKRLACRSVNRIGKEDERVEIELFHKAGLKYRSSEAVFPSNKDTNQEPVAWLNGDRLLAREFRYDVLDRLQASRLVAVSLSEKDQDVTLQVEPLTDLPQTQLEIYAASCNSYTALQAYDEQKQTFQIGILPAGGKTINWLSAPEGYARGLNRPAAQMAWSADGRFLAVTFRSLETWVWDTREQRWLSRGKRPTLYTQRYGLLWLDADRVLLLSPSMMGDTTSLYGGSMSKPQEPLTFVGEIEGIRVQKLFRLRQGAPAR